MNQDWLKQIEHYISDESIHPLLRRQLRKLISVMGEKEACSTFLTRVHEAYAAADDDHVLVERSLDLSSKELLSLNAELKEAKENAEAVARDLFANLDVGILLIDEERNIQEINDYGLKLFSIENDEVHTLDLSSMIQAYSYDETVGNKQSVLTHKSKHIDILYSQAYVSAKNGSEFKRKILIIHDITDRVKIEQDLKEAKLASESASLAKTQFLSSMSHELRTPLTSIILLSEMIRDKVIDDTKELSESGRVIYSSAKDLLFLINQILDLSKIESGTVECDFKPLNIHEFLSDIHAKNLVRAEEKSLKFNIEIDEKSPSQIVTDGQLVHQIITNFIANAIKFTSKGFVQISVRLDEEDASSLLFSVSDSGMGIPKDKQKHVFDAFTQADNSTTRPYGGTGLGLAIGKKLATLIGGDILLQSEENQGSTFTLRIPIQHKVGKFTAVLDKDNFKTSDKVLKKQEKIEKKQLDDGPRKTKVLIVDDDVRSVYSLMLLLKNQGFDIESVGDGAACLELLMEDTFDIILLDIMMPVLDGYDTLKRIRESVEWDDLPVIVLTSKSLPGEREKSLDLGAQDFMNKPIDQLKLVSLIKKYTKKQ